MHRGKYCWWLYDNNTTQPTPSPSPRPTISPKPTSTPGPTPTTNPSPSPEPTPTNTPLPSISPSPQPEEFFPKMNYVPSDTFYTSIYTTSNTFNYYFLRVTSYTQLLKLVTENITLSAKNLCLFNLRDDNSFSNIFTFNNEFPSNSQMYFGLGGKEQLLEYIDIVIITDISPFHSDNIKYKSSTHDEILFDGFPLTEHSIIPHISSLTSTQEWCSISYTNVNIIDIGTLQPLLYYSTFDNLSLYPINSITSLIYNT